MAEQFDEFLEEVQKDIRQEKLLKLWKQYAKQIISGVVAVLVIVIGYNLWGHYQQNKRIQMADKMISAQEMIARGETEKAKVVLNSLSGYQNTYEQLGHFQKAGLLIQLGSEDNLKEAIGIYDQIASNTKIDTFWRELASLLFVMNNVDLPGRNIEELINKINPLTSDQNPWRYFAKEMKALLLYQKGEVEKGIELFIQLVQDNQTPAGISMRSRLMIQIASTGLSN